MKKILVIQTGDWIPDEESFIEYLTSIQNSLGQDYYIIVAPYGVDVKCITEEDAVEHLKLSVDILKTVGKDTQEIVKLIEEN